MCAQRGELARTDHGLKFGVLGETFLGELAPNAGLLESPEGTGDVEHVHVDAVGAGADLAGEMEYVCDALAAVPPRQPVVAVVGDSDGVTFVAVLDDGEDGTEDLLARN